MFTVMQIVLIVVTNQIIETLRTNCQFLLKYGGQQVLKALVVGIIMGDVPTALLIGGTMQLMSMGIAGYGGTPIPNYNLAVTVSTAYCLACGLKGDAALAMAMTIGVPTATLGLSLDSLARTINSFWYHKALKDVENREYKKLYRDVFIGEYCFGKSFISITLPLAIFLIAGQPVVEAILTYMPAWLTSSLKTVSGVLPALGVALLMIFMPVKENLHWLLLGYVLYAYFNLQMLPIALVGLVIAVVIYKRNEKERTAGEKQTAQGGLGDE